MRISSLFPILYAPSSGEVQFNCPWCSTRLALPAADFSRERAVLCPRCNNPVDLSVQRRTIQVPAPTPAAPPRRQVTVPPAPAKQPPRRQSAPSTVPVPDPPALPPLEKKKQESVALNFEPDKPIDIDAAFKGEPIHVDDIDSLVSRSDLWSMAGPRRSITGAGGSQKPGEASGVVVCPSCAYENPPIPPGFEFGKVRKCTWCSKPLP